MHIRNPGVASLSISIGTVALAEREARCGLPVTRRSDRERQFVERLGEALLH
jgi:hypothetical protein